MVFGMNNQTIVNMENITELSNVTNLPEFMIKVNHIVYGGWLYFILLMLFWIILFFIAQDYKDDLLNNAMYTGAVITILSFLFRVIVMTQAGIVYGLLNDSQMWLFPLITIILAAIVWSTKRT